MNKQATNIFVVEDNKFYANLIKETLLLHNHSRVKLFHTAQEFINNIHQNPEIVILDYGLGQSTGLEVLKEIKSINPNIQVIFLSAQEKIEVAITALKYGAYDYLDKTDSGIHRLGNIIKKIIRTNSMIGEINKYEKLKKWFYTILGVSVFSLAFMYYFLTH